MQPFVVRWHDAVFERDAAADPSRALKPGKAPKPAARTTYKRATGLGERFRELFRGMPPKAHSRKDAGHSEVLCHIRETLVAAGVPALDPEKIFDAIRHYRYQVIVYKHGRWQGCDYPVEPPEGGAQ